MPPWPGGPCPGCGAEMPPNLIHCQECRHLLNSDLDTDSVEIPTFIPLQEISSMVEVEAAGYFVTCPHCDRELRIARKYVGENVQCKLCKKPFKMQLGAGGPKSDAFFTDCPHCKEELRAAHKYLGANAACKHCGGKIHFKK
jgi:hypothetical protein